LLSSQSGNCKRMFNSEWPWQRKNEMLQAGCAGQCGHLSLRARRNTPLQKVRLRFVDYTVAIYLTGCHPVGNSKRSCQPSAGVHWSDLPVQSLSLSFGLDHSGIPSTASPCWIALKLTRRSRGIYQPFALPLCTGWLLSRELCDTENAQETGANVTATRIFESTATAK